MIRDAMIVKRVKAPGTADFHVHMSALGFSDSEVASLNEVVLLSYTDSSLVAKVVTGAKVAITNTGTVTSPVWVLAVTKATAQAANDLYTVGLLPTALIVSVTGET